jgi:DNA-binding winged helix-turn-helix (wHTH) protein/Flp pilus assembly protein TadD
VAMERARVSTFEVGDWHVTPALNSLERAGHSVRIETRSMDVLAHLAAHSGETISVDELLATIWQSNVSHGSVYRVINQLRHVLDGDRNESHYIQTIPKRGYRLVANVRFHSAQASSIAETHQLSDRTLSTSLLSLSPWLRDISLQRLGYILSTVLVLTVIAGTLIRGGINDADTPEIVTQIAFSSEAEPLSSERVDFEQTLTDSSDAYALYLRATLLVQLPVTHSSPDMFSEAHGYLDQAIALDPRFAHAHAYKALMFATKLGGVTRLSDELTSSERETLAMKHVEIALRLNPNLGLAYCALGRLHESFFREAEAKQAYERAYQSSPDELSVLSAYLNFSLHTGRYDDAFRLAGDISKLDPGHGQLRLSFSLLWAGEYDAAADAMEKTIELLPGSSGGHFGLGWAELLRGNSAEALEKVRFTRQIVGDNSFLSPSQLSVSAYTYRRLGNHEDAMKYFREVEAMAANYNVGSATWALAYLAIGDQDKSLEWLTRAAENRMPDEGFSVMWLIRRNLLEDPILEQTEFADVRSRLGFDKG